MSRCWLNRDPIEEDGDQNLFRFVLNAPPNYGDPFGLNPGDKFPNSEDAAKDACNYIYPKTKSEQVEYGGWIEKNPDGSFTYKEPQKGEKNHLNQGPKPNNASAMFHSHNKGPGNEYFSGSKEGWRNKLMNLRPGAPKEGIPRTQITQVAHLIWSRPKET